jgi:hypothetical protein
MELHTDGNIIYLFSIHHPSVLEILALQKTVQTDSGVPRNFVRGGGGQQIQLRTEDRENGDLGVVAP